MPVLEKGKLKLDYIDEGEGPVIVLLHSSASGNRQWRGFIKSMRSNYRLLAVNLFGYGDTTVWSSVGTQTFYAQVELIKVLVQNLQEPFSLVGHSFGGAVAMRAALSFGRQVEKLVLFEPIPFHLLRQNGPSDIYLEAITLLHHVKCYGSLGDWSRVAETFADYWSGVGTWERMPEDRKAIFTKNIVPAFYEVDSLISEDTTIQQFGKISAQTLALYATTTQRPIHALMALFKQECDSWTVQELNGVGHMAPLTHPDLFASMVHDFLSTEERRGVCLG
ncbi:alpha/beta hydrolase [Pusillimonas sp. DMV24BSW_D]|uniref:alpha/beta fold hydrolase n=1 Tax=Neopusillimonas aestuarii TaxID=2716226 RepID=UPI00140B00C4|nr:alpha/beta hydrolase [Pusillimonas sp. DMV24BSW_D]QIM47916.1 alpha/beta hydrolase [Pusillimonas sp. DMV24BSW_D]